MIENVKNEPVVTLVIGLIGAAAAVLAAFGVHLNDTQVMALEGLVAPVFGLTLWVRSKVTPTRKLEPARSSWSAVPADQKPIIIPPAAAPVDSSGTVTVVTREDT